MLGAQWLLMAIPVLLVLLVRAGLRLDSALRGADVIRLDRAPQQLVTFERAGDFGIYADVPYEPRPNREQPVTLTEVATGANTQAVPGWPTRLVKNWSSQLVQLYWFRIPTPGDYMLRIAGDWPAGAGEDSRLFVSRPMGATIALWCVVVVALAVGTLLCLILGGLALSR